MFSIDIIVFQCVINERKTESALFHFISLRERLKGNSINLWKSESRMKGGKLTNLSHNRQCSFGNSHPLSQVATMQYRHHQSWYARDLLLQRYYFHLKTYKKCCVILTIKIHIYLLYPCYTFAIATVITPLSLRYHSDILPRDDRETTERRPIQPKTADFVVISL